MNRIYRRTKKTSITVSHEEFELMLRLAFRNNTTVSDGMREAIRQYLEQRGDLTQHETPKKDFQITG